MSKVRATRGYLAGFGTAGSLLAGAAVLFVLASALVSFQGWPSISGREVASVVVVHTPKATAVHVAPSRRVLSAFRATAPAVHPVVSSSGASASSAGGTAQTVGGGTGTPTPVTSPGGASAPTSPVCGTCVVTTTTGVVLSTTSTVDNVIGKAGSAVGSVVTGTTSKLGSGLGKVSNPLGSTVSSLGQVVGSTVTQTSQALGGAVGQIGQTAGGVVGQILH
jgi:hypothetical protein